MVGGKGSLNGLEPKWTLIVWIAIVTKHKLFPFLHVSDGSYRHCFCLIVLLILAIGFEAMVVHAYIT